MILLSISSSGQKGSEVIEYNTKVTVKKNLVITEVSCIIQVNNKESAWITDIIIPFRSNDKLEIIEALAISPLGQTFRKLKKNDFRTRSNFIDGVFFTDELLKEFDIKWNEYPYLIKYTYRRTSKDYVFFAKWVPIVFKNIPVRKALLRVEVPNDCDVNFDFSDKFDYIIEKEKEFVVHQWQIDDFHATDEGLFLPPYYETLPHVWVVPEKFKYEKDGSNKSWKSFGKWQEGLIADCDILPEKEKLQINSLIEGIDNPKEIVKLLYYYLQDNTRYINVSIDTGGLKPYPASYVSEKRYGDCKALTLYMKALLNYAGIESFYTLVNAGEKPLKIKTEIPSQQFNHVLLTVPIRGDTIWLENTVDYLPFKYLGVFIHNRYGLLVDGDNSRLINIPALHTDDLAEKRFYRFILDEKGNGKVVLNCELRGKAFEFYRYVFKQNNEEKQKQLLSESIPLNDFFITGWEFDNVGRDESFIRASIYLEAKNQFRVAGNMIFVNPHFGVLPSLKIQDKNKIRVNYPKNEYDSIIYILPVSENYKITLPENVSINSRFGNYNAIYSFQDNVITVAIKNSLYSDEYPEDAFDEFAYYYNSVIESQRKSTILLLKP